MKTAPAAAKPGATTDLDTTLKIQTATGNPFTCFAGTPATDSTKKLPVFAFYLQRKTSYSYYKPGSTDSVWTTRALSGTANIENTGF